MQTTPARLHGEAQSQENNRRIVRAIRVLAIATALAAIGVVCSLIFRDATHMHNPNERASQLITIGITLLWGCFCIFFWGMKLTPLLRYRHYLADMASGLSRVEEGVVVRFEEQTSFRDGLGYRAMLINIGNLKEPEDERLLYWDPRLGIPSIAEGARVRLLAHGNDIIGMDILSNA